MEQDHDVEVRRGRSAACHDAAAQERGARFGVLFIYDGACGLDRIHAATISTGPTARTPFSADGPRGVALSVFSSPGADSKDPRMTGQRRKGM
ncbi:hypothetical protein [Streptomyces griseosporeus]|uniref:hypothetical protein n=1 Tax=Streptomyces griseosporeus TaxID=1910 RepID=UPI0035D1D0C5